MTINKEICPEDVVLLLLPVGMIPDRSKVSKRTGEVQYILLHDLHVYPVKEAKGLRPERLVEDIHIKGFFLMGERGDVNQVEAKTHLHWHVTAEDLVRVLQESWEETPQ